MREKYVINDVTTVIKKINEKISKNAKMAFYCTAILTFLSHLVFFVDRFANEDDFHNLLSSKNMIGSGRWMIGNIFGSNYLLPMVLFVITIISISLCSSVINSMFKIEKNVYIFLISSLLATFPVLALGFGYSFMIERYMLGLLSAVLAVYFTNKYNKGFIVGSFLLGISLGYYQSYVAVSIGLSIFLIIMKGFEQLKIREYFGYILNFLIMGIIGVIFYLLMIKVSCNLSGISLLTYKGINNIGSLPPISKIPFLILRTYKHFFGFFIGKSFLKPYKWALYFQIILVIINILLFAILVRKTKVYKEHLKFFILLMLVFITPLGLNITDFIAYETYVSSLNIYQFVFVFISPFVLIEYINQHDNCKNDGDYKRNLIPFFEWIICIAVIILNWHNFVITNTYYLKLNYFYNSTVQLTNRILYRLESTPGFDTQTKVFVANSEGIYNGLRNNYNFKEIFINDQGLWDQFIGYYPRPEGSDYKFRYLVSNVLGVKLNLINNEEIKNIYNSKKFKKMESWPHEKSIKFINDILVVKVS